MATANNATKRTREDDDLLDRLSKVARMSEKDTITVTVGEEVKKTFVVHQDFVTKRSPFFSLVCDRLNGEQREKRITLLGTQP